MSPRRLRGLSLVELMVALVIGSLLIVGALTTFAFSAARSARLSSMRQSYHTAGPRIRRGRALASCSAWSACPSR